MTVEALQQIWKAYLNTYGDVAADERKRLLRQSVTDDVVFTGPNEDDQGFSKLVEHIGQFQKKSPGARFESNNLLTQHGQLLSAVDAIQEGRSKDRNRSHVCAIQ